VSEGIGGVAGSRNAPSLLNVQWQRELFWDGRSSSLADQAIRPLFNRAEHGLRGEAELVDILNADAWYVQAFESAFSGSPPSVSTKHAAQALACFERTLIAANSPFDQYEFEGKKDGMSAAAVRGLSLFRGRARCTGCHQIEQQAALFSDKSYHRRGIGLQKLRVPVGELVKQAQAIPRGEIDSALVTDPQLAALGRYLVTGDPADIGRFKTPSLRNVALTAPYMHDGSIGTLQDAVRAEAYYGPEEGASPVVLSAREVDDLVEFLRSLTSASLLDVRPMSARK